MIDRFESLHSIFPWEPGQHVAIVGDTGTGKTTVARRILDWRRFVVALRSKMDAEDWPGYKKIKRNARGAMESLRFEKILVAPERLEKLAEFGGVLEQVYRQENWTLFVDDLTTMQRLGAPIHAHPASHKKSLIDELLTDGRSKGITVVTAQQLPVDTTKYAIAESYITISFMLNDKYAKVVAEKTNALMGEVIAGLGHHDLAIFDRRTHQVWTGRLNLATDEFEGHYVEEPRAAVRA